MFNSRLFDRNDEILAVERFRDDRTPQANHQQALGPTLFRIYPLTQARNPPTYPWIDVSDRRVDLPLIE